MFLASGTKSPLNSVDPFSPAATLHAHRHAGGARARAVLPANHSGARFTSIGLVAPPRRPRRARGESWFVVRRSFVTHVSFPGGWIMRFQSIFAASVAAVAISSIFASSARAITYSVGNNPGGTSAVVEVDSGPFGGNNPSFTLTAGVDQDPASGNLLKDFTQTSQGSGGPNSGLSSGRDVPIDETFSNDGTETWTAWDEAVVSQTDFGGPMGPGFLFDTSVTVSRNGTTLTPGVDYTLTGTTFTQFGNSGYESLTISFSPGSQIQPSDMLRIQKNIHEVFGDGNVWTLGEAARVAEFPSAVPEPATLGLVAMTVLATGFRRRRR